MQYLDNDMDELFCKAAENYPLRTEAKGWDDIAPALIKTPVLNAPRNTEKRKYSWLLLIGFLFITTTTVSILLFKINSGLSGTVTAKDNLSKKADRDNTNIPHNSQKKNAANHNTISLRSQPVKNSISEPLPADEISISPVSKSINIAVTVEPAKVNNINSIVYDSARLISIPLISKEKVAIIKPGFYFGIVAGPQLNQVKSQGYNKPGLSTGILAGYRVNKNISIETGIFYSKKHYYSEGKYFNMKNVSSSMPPGMKMISLNGNSTVFEIPVKLKYEFLKKTKSGLFSTAGISSYLLTKESNDYLALVNGNQESMEGTYQHATNYFTAAINFSIGYHYKIGKQTSIRVEPHIQIPIRGIGVGSMPVTSAGLHIGIIWNHK